jgi:uncharacterized protein YacL
VTNEPVLTATTIGAVVGAFLALLIAFGAPIGNEQVQAILTFVGVLAPVVLSAVYARSRVTPTDRR